MRLIVSAFVAGATPNENALATAALINSCEEFAMTIVQGCYNGVQETALMLDGFVDIEHLHVTAAELCGWYKQTCVYYSVGGVGSLLHADGRHQTIGPERHYPADMVHSHLFRSIYQNYTVLPDGSAIAAQNALRVAA